MRDDTERNPDICRHRSRSEGESGEDEGERGERGGGGERRREVPYAVRGGGGEKKRGDERE